MKTKTALMACLCLALFTLRAEGAPPLLSTVESDEHAIQANSWLEIDAEAFEHNLKTVQKLLTGKAMICPVMKADAYGHRITLLLPKVLKLDISCIGVTSNDEIRVLRENGFKGRIMRLRSATPDEIRGAIPYNVEELLGNLEVAQLISKIASGTGKPIPVHIALNSSGMSRNGIDLALEQGKKDVQEIVSNANLTIVGIMTHFPKEEKESVMEGLKKFKKETEWLIKTGKLDRDKITLHAANSFATLNVPEAHLDLVRPGLVLYGDWETDDKAYKRVFSAFKSRVAAVNHYPKGNAVGYDGTHILSRDSKLANIPVGYSDGYRRSFGNKGHVLINGQRAPVVGKISMNTFMVDVTDFKEPVKPGDEVVLLGRQGDAVITQSEVEDLNGDYLFTTSPTWGYSNYVILKK